MYYRISDLYHDERSGLNCVEVEFWLSQGAFESGEPPALVEDFRDNLTDKQLYAHIFLARYLRWFMASFDDAAVETGHRKGDRRDPRRDPNRRRGMRRNHRNLLGRHGDLDSLPQWSDRPEGWRDEWPPPAPPGSVLL